MKTAFLLLFSSAAFAQTTAGTDQTGSVTGTVTDAITHIPVKKTMVSVQPMGIMGGGRNQGAQSAVTDAGGTFTIGNLAAGKYRLMFQQQNYPSARFGGVSKTVDVKPGEATAPVTVELIPGAAVSGHIVDEDGDPVLNCNVQLHPAKNPDQGAPMTGISMSNDDGEYRAYGIAPGKYILSAQCRQALFHPRPFSAGPDQVPSKAYPMQYYPLTSELKAAQVVELTAGSEKSGIDFQMMPTAVTQVRGAFLPGGADWHGSNPLMLQLTSLDQRGMNIGAALNQEKGTFEFRQVFSGSYILMAFSNGSDQNRIGAWKRVDVLDRPVDMALELRSAVDVSGKVEIESSANTTNKVTPGQIQVMVTSQYQFAAPQTQTQVSDDGTFTLKGVMPAPWRLRANGPAVFLKSAWLGSTDVTNASMDLSAGAAGALRIVVSTNTATIRGSAPAGQTIFAQQIDDDMPYRSNRGTQVDPSGQYKFEGLAPGKYRLILMESGGPMPDEGGQEVSVHEGETMIADLKAP
jgi:hypothetical protein